MAVEVSSEQTFVLGLTKLIENWPKSNRLAVLYWEWILGKIWRFWFKNDVLKVWNKFSIKQLNFKSKHSLQKPTVLSYQVYLIIVQKVLKDSIAFHYGQPPFAAHRWFKDFIQTFCVDFNQLNWQQWQRKPRRAHLQRWGRKSHWDPILQFLSIR